MNRETFKSVLLVMLVFLSIGMTWNILFYRSDFEKYKGTTIAKTVSIADSRMPSSVIRPLLFLQHSVKAGTLGETQTGTVSKAYNLFQQTFFSGLVPLTYHAQLPVRKDDLSYEIIFPAPLMHDTLERFFHFSNKGAALQADVLIDRIEIYQTDRGGLIAVFSSSNGQNQFFATAERLKLSTLKDVFAKSVSALYEQVHLKDRLVYAPTGPTALKSVIFYYQMKKVDAFIPTLFNNPDNNVFHSNKKLTYTDGTSQLEQNGDVLQYVNINPGISSSQQLTDPIYHSYEYLNNFKEWTGDFSYAGLQLSDDSKSETVLFRMRIGNYLVFNTDDYPNPYLTQIELTWRSGQLSSFNRTLLKLNSIDETQSDTLPSGADVLRRLGSESVPVNKIQDLMIGYQLRTPDSQEDNSSLEATPDWFYEISDRWYAASKAVGQQQKEAGSP